MNDRVNRTLVKMYRAGNQLALNKLLESNKKLCYKFAHRYSKNRDLGSVKFNDLVQESVLGIKDSADKFDLDITSTTFATFCVWQMLHRCDLYMRANYNVMNTPTNSKGLDLTKYEVIYSSKASMNRDDDFKSNIFESIKVECEEPFDDGVLNYLLGTLEDKDRSLLWNYYTNRESMLDGLSNEAKHNISTKAYNIRARLRKTVNNPFKMEKII